MISYLQAIVLGIIQGVTELFPISSLGHSVIVPSFLSWNIDQNGDPFVVFLVATHFATALVLLGFFWKDWVKDFSRIFSFDCFQENRWRRLCPARVAHHRCHDSCGTFGTFFEKKFAALFGAPKSAALFLIANGILLFAAEKMRRKSIIPAKKISSDEKVSKISWIKSFGIGCAQILALVPGFSRTGAALSGGLFSGLDHESAARFAFLLATPIIFAAALLKLPSLFHGGYPVGATLAGALFAAFGAYLSVKFLTKYFKTKPKPSRRLLSIASLRESFRS